MFSNLLRFGLVLCIGLVTIGLFGRTNAAAPTAAGDFIL